MPREFLRSRRSFLSPPLLATERNGRYSSVTLIAPSCILLVPRSFSLRHLGTRVCWLALIWWVAVLGLTKRWCFTVPSYQCHGASNRLFVQQPCLGNIRQNIKYLHHWPFVLGIHWWLVDFSDLRPANERRRYFVTTFLIAWAQDKVPVVRKAFPSHDVWLESRMAYPWQTPLRVCFHHSFPQYISSYFKQPV